MYIVHTFVLNRLNSKLTKKLTFNVYFLLNIILREQGKEYLTNIKTYTCIAACLQLQEGMLNEEFEIRI